MPVVALYVHTFHFALRTVNRLHLFAASCVPSVDIFALSHNGRTDFKIDVAAGGAPATQVVFDHEL